MKRPEFIKKSLFGIFAGITIPSFATSKEKISEKSAIYPRDNYAKNKLKTEIFLKIMQ